MTSFWWINKKRDHGNLLFVDLRDNYGITQCIIDKDNSNFSSLEKIQLETVIKINGKVIERTKETINKDLSTGEIEVAIEEYVERSVANADVENYNIADVVSEVNVELFLENPIGAIIDVDLSGIELTNIGADMPDTQREKAQEVFAPVVLTQIVAITRRRIIW